MNSIHISEKIFSPIRTARDLADHVRRVQETSFEHPVIMDPSGFIVDGWHRVTKALLEGRDTIPAVRFKEMPAWEYTDT
jgi:ParB-like chromosome segregation protein Spo0J